MRFASLLCLGAAAVWPAARLELVPPEFDWGDVNEGVVAEHVFPSRNAGDDTLRIEKVKPHCGCTGSVLSANTVAPGGSGFGIRHSVLDMGTSEQCGMGILPMLHPNLP